MTIINKNEDMDTIDFIIVLLLTLCIVICLLEINCLTIENNNLKESYKILKEQQ